jgi:hypothetical protein
MSVAFRGRGRESFSGKPLSMLGGKTEVKDD